MRPRSANRRTIWPHRCPRAFLSLRWVGYHKVFRLRTKAYVNIYFPSKHCSWIRNLNFYILFLNVQGFRVNVESMSGNVLLSSGDMRLFFWECTFSGMGYLGKECQISTILYRDHLIAHNPETQGITKADGKQSLGSSSNPPTLQDLRISNVFSTL